MTSPSEQRGGKFFAPKSIPCKTFGANSVDADVFEDIEQRHDQGAIIAVREHH